MSEGIYLHTNRYGHPIFTPKAHAHFQQLEIESRERLFDRLKRELGPEWPKQPAEKIIVALQYARDLSSHVDAERLSEELSRFAVEQAQPILAEPLERAGELRPLLVALSALRYKFDLAIHERMGQLEEEWQGPPEVWSILWRLVVRRERHGDAIWCEVAAALARHEREEVVNFGDELFLDERWIDAVRTPLKRLYLLFLFSISPCDRKKASAALQELSLPSTPRHRSYLRAIDWAPLLECALSLETDLLFEETLLAVAEDRSDPFLVVELWKAGFFSYLSEKQEADAVLMVATTCVGNRELRERVLLGLLNYDYLWIEEELRSKFEEAARLCGLSDSNIVHLLWLSSVRPDLYPPPWPIAKLLEMGPLEAKRELVALLPTRNYPVVIDADVFAPLITFSIDLLPQLPDDEAIDLLAQLYATKLIEPTILPAALFSQIYRLWDGQSPEKERLVPLLVHWVSATSGNWEWTASPNLPVVRVAKELLLADGKETDPVIAELAVRLVDQFEAEPTEAAGEALFELALSKRSKSLFTLSLRLRITGALIGSLGRKEIELQGAVRTIEALLHHSDLHREIGTPRLKGQEARQIQRLLGAALPLLSTTDSKDDLSLATYLLCACTKWKRRKGSTIPADVIETGIEVVAKQIASANPEVLTQVRAANSFLWSIANRECSSAEERERRASALVPAIRVLSAATDTTWLREAGAWIHLTSLRHQLSLDERVTAFVAMGVAVLQRSSGLVDYVRTLHEIDLTERSTIVQKLLNHAELPLTDASIDRRLALLATGVHVVHAPEDPILAQLLSLYDSVKSSGTPESLAKVMGALALHGVDQLENHNEGGDTFRKMLPRDHRALITLYLKLYHLRYPRHKCELAAPPSSFPQKEQRLVAIGLAQAMLMRTIRTSLWATHDDYPLVSEQLEALHYWREKLETERAELAQESWLGQYTCDPIVRSISASSDVCEGALLLQADREELVEHGLERLRRYLSGGVPTSPHLPPLLPLFCVVGGRRILRQEGRKDRLAALDALLEMADRCRLFRNETALHIDLLHFALLRCEEVERGACVAYAQRLFALIQNNSHLSINGLRVGIKEWGKIMKQTGWQSTLGEIRKIAFGMRNHFIDSIFEIVRDPV